MQFQEDFFKKHGVHEISILLLQNGEPVKIPLTGHCMKPLLCENDLITIQPVSTKQLKCGDIAIYHINGRLKAHRFLFFKRFNGQKYIITKSDRRLYCDRPVPVSNLLGKIIKVNKGKKTINYENNKWEIINYCIGKLSPYISKIEYSIKFIIRFPRKCASKIFRLLFGMNYRAYLAKRSCK